VAGAMTVLMKADGVDYEPEAEAKVELYTRLGFDRLPNGCRP